MMFQLPPLKVNLPKPKYRKQEVVTEDGRRVKCLRRDTYLDMSQMALTIFPKMVLRCDDLETLLFSRNFLREIPRKISRLDCLEKLDLSYNRFNEFPEEVLAVTSLKELDLSHNTIPSIPIDIRHLRYLKVLNLSDNRIKRLPNNLKNLTSLIYLNISSNKLEEFPLVLCSCYPQLQILKCSYNFISILPYEIIMLPELCLKPDAVDFRHNPLTWPPVEVCNRGFEAMRNYIEPKWRELKEFKRRKIVANTLGQTKTNMTRRSLWDTPPSVSSKSSSTNLLKVQETPPTKKNQKKQPDNETNYKQDKSGQKPTNTTETQKTKGGKLVKTPKKKKAGNKNPSRESPDKHEIGGDLDDSSRATLVEVYGDGSSPALHQLSPLPDTWTPAKTPVPDTPGKGVWTPAPGDRNVGGYDEDDRDSELLDLINQSFEPPDLDLPESLMNMSCTSGGGMLEQWLGTVQSLTMSPTMTRDASCASTELESSNQAVNAFTPFSDVKITKNSLAQSGGSEDEEDEEEEEEEEEIRMLLPEQGEMSEERAVPRHSISTPAEQKEVRSKVKKSAPTLKTLRSNSIQSAVSIVSESNTTASVTKGTKKKKRKKRKKKLKKEESELEIYSRIPYKPLFIAPRMVPSAHGLKTWAYFNEPKSCYLIDNMTEISSSAKRVTFGADEITIMRSSPSTKSLLTESCIALNSSNSSLDRSTSVHSIESNQSQIIGDSLSSMSRFSSPTSSPLGLTSNKSPVSSTALDSLICSPAPGNWRGVNNFKSRPASLPAPKQHTWTSEELQKFIFRPSDLMIPPKVLISYLKLDNDVVHTNLILKLVNTLELNGLAECVCDLTTKSGYDFEELGYFDWLNEKVEECEFVLVIMSKHYVSSLSVLTKLDGLAGSSSTPHRTSPYITAADISRWGLSPSEVHRRFIPVLNDDMEQLQTPSWIQQLPYFVPSEICELGYHLISRDYRESVAIPNIFESSQNSGLNAEGAEESKADQLALSLSDIGSQVNVQDSIPPDVFRVMPVTAHLVVSPQDIPPDWRLEEVAGKLRYNWRDFAQTCGFDGETIADIDSVYNSSLNKSVQCMKLWKSRLVGNATYEELARRLGQIDQTHIAVAYCNFGGVT